MASNGWRGVVSLPGGRPGPPPRLAAGGPGEEVHERGVMSRRRFLGLGLGTVAGVTLFGGAGCGRARRIARGPRERTGGEGEDRESKRGRRGFGLGRLLRRLL
jgi:hypothetical protein